MAKIYAPKEKRRFGIGEWFGESFVNLTRDRRKQLAKFAMQSVKEANQNCPFQSTPTKAVTCNKKGGVCSLRLYSNDGSNTVAVSGIDGQPRAVCPRRFRQGESINKWIGETVLECTEPQIIAEVGFLENRGDDPVARPSVSAAPIQNSASDKSGDDVGRIDSILLVPNSKPLQWCALEIQAVYFSGPAMGSEFKLIADAESEVPGLIFPAKVRRPDYRSSGPKRLMPQLQIKVPTLRRWGKKMAVVVDSDFFRSLGKMDEIDNISNADIAWFIMKFDESDGGNRIRLVKDRVQFTTLERAVEGLTGGVPVSLSEFERRIAEKLLPRQISTKALYRTTTVEQSK